MGMIREARQRLERWIEGENFQGWDPFDALNSPILRALTFHNRRIGQLWVQLLKKSPINLRPILLIQKGYNPKGIGLFLASYLRIFMVQNDEASLQHVRYFGDWLIANKSTGYHGACWGYNFDWPNRGFFAPRGTPSSVSTAFNALAFLDIHSMRDEVKSASLEKIQPLAIARSACDFFLEDLHSESSTKGEICFSYTPLDFRYIHNANLLVARVLAEVSALTREGLLEEKSLAAAHYTVRHQRPDGSWWYGEQSIDQWIDNFHTGYVLTALQKIAFCLRTNEFHTAIEKGYTYWKDTFFLEDGTPKYYANKIWPVDIHAVAQAILTFLAFKDQDNKAVTQAIKIAEWGITNMQTKHGYFIYQKDRYYRNKIPFMRWSQAWMLRALVELEVAGIL